MSNPPLGRTSTNTNYYWPPASEVPNDFNVIIFFHGLMCFCYNRDNYCEIGIHNKALHHNLKIKILELSALPDPTSGGVKEYMNQIYNFQENIPVSPAVDLIRVSVVNPNSRGALDPSQPGVTYYQGKDFNRAKDVGDYSDFRWITDLEGPDFYDQTLKKKPEAFHPRLLINNGVFYTWRRTKTRFSLRSSMGDRYYGRVAHYIAANISVADGGYLSMYLDEHEVRLNTLPGRLYGIMFDNGCPQDVCNYDSDSNVKERRNDFYHYYETIELPPFREEYELVKASNIHATGEESAQQSKTDTARGRGPFLEIFEALLGDNRSSDDAPCGASGYGSSGCIHC